MKRIIIIMSCIVVGVLVWLAFFAPFLIWDGSVGRSLTLHLTHRDSRKPIEGMTFILLSRNEINYWDMLKAQDREAWLTKLTELQSAGRTSADGSVTLRGHFPAGGYSAMYRKKGSYHIAGTLIIIKDNEVIDTKRLEDLIPQENFNIREELPLIQLSLP